MPLLHGVNSFQTSHQFLWYNFVKNFQKFDNLLEMHKIFVCSDLALITKSILSYSPTLRITLIKGFSNNGNFLCWTYNIWKRINGLIISYNQRNLIKKLELKTKIYAECTKICKKNCDKPNFDISLTQSVPL